MPRLVDVPIEPTEAGAFLASCLKSGRRRRINVGELDGRYFLFSAGMGLDGEVVKRVEANPAEKRKHKDWVFVKYALKLGLTQYRTTNPALTVHIDGHEPFRIVCAICCNACPMTYLKGLPVAGCPEARLDEGLDIFGLSKLRAVTVPRVLWSVMVNRSHIRWRTSFYHHDTNGARLVADHPMAVQVDGDYIGDLEKADIRLVRDALSVLA